MTANILMGEFAQRQQIAHFPTIWIPKIELCLRHRLKPVALNLFCQPESAQA